MNIFIFSESIYMDGKKALVSHFKTVLCMYKEFLTFIQRLESEFLIIINNNINVEILMRIFFVFEPHRYILNVIYFK